MSEKLEVFNKELENTKNQKVMRNSITKMKNTQEGIKVDYMIQMNRSASWKTER